jgi:predicted  nucleic acid-binding Zn-ribbon protein
MPGGDIERLSEAMQQLHDEVGSMREEFAELNERMDFTERMLSEVRSRNAIGPGDS